MIKMRRVLVAMSLVASMAADAAFHCNVKVFAGGAGIRPDAGFGIAGAERTMTVSAETVLFVAGSFETE